MASLVYGGNQEVHFLLSDLDKLGGRLEEILKRLQQLRDKGAEITGEEDREFGMLLMERATLSRRRQEIEAQIGTSKVSMS